MKADHFDRLARGAGISPTRRRFGGGMLGVLAALLAVRRGGADDGPRLVVLSPMAARPQLTNIRVDEVTPTSAVVAWSTDVAADSTVEYGETMDYGSAVADPAPVAEHRVALTGLLPETEYHYRVRSRGDAGTSSTRRDRTFMTDAACSDAACGRDVDCCDPNAACVGGQCVLSQCIAGGGPGDWMRCESLTGVTPLCGCMTTPEGRGICVAIPGSGRKWFCHPQMECATSSDCWPGGVCVDMPGCFPDGIGACWNACDS